MRSKAKGQGRASLYIDAPFSTSSLDEASALSPAHCCTVLLLGCSLVLDNPWISHTIDDPK